MTTTSFHKSNFGMFGEQLPCDLDGFVHLTAEGWMNAPMDWDGGTEDWDEDSKADMCEQLAENARKLTEEAETKLAEWREGAGKR